MILVDVTNRFKGLDLVDRIHNTEQGAVAKNFPKEKNCKKKKKLSEEAQQIVEERREMKSKGEREKYTQLNAEFQGISRRD